MDNGISALLDEAKTHSQIHLDSELAAEIDVTKAAISRWRRKVTVPDDQYVPALARLSGLSVESVQARLEAGRLHGRALALKDRILSRLKAPNNAGALTQERRVKHHDPKIPEQAREAIAQSLSVIAQQTSSSRSGLRRVARDLWTHGYTCGLIEAALEGCGVTQEAAVADMLQVALEALLASRERAAAALNKMQTFYSRDDFMSGCSQGELDWVAFSSGSASPTGLLCYLKQVK